MHGWPYIHIRQPKMSGLDLIDCLVSKSVDWENIRVFLQHVGNDHVFSEIGGCSEFLVVRQILCGKEIYNRHWSRDEMTWRSVVEIAYPFHLLAISSIKPQRESLWMKRQLQNLRSLRAKGYIVFQSLWICCLSITNFSHCWLRRDIYSDCSIWGFALYFF